MLTVLEPERLYPDTAEEQRILGPDVRVLHGGGEGSIAQLPDEVCAEVDGLFVFRNWLSAADIARFPKLRVVVRMGVGYDRLDRAALAARGVKVCNVPDYGTTEVADHAITLALALRRGITMHHDLQRADPPAPWAYVATPIHQRMGDQTYGILGLGRIGTAVALRAKAFGCRVVFHDPYLPNGVERALGIERARTKEELLARSNILSLHAPLTRNTRGLVGEKELRTLPAGAVVVNTARGPMLDIEALYNVLRDGHLAAAGLDVIPDEPPVEPIPRLLAAYRAREAWLEGRLIITPHSAFYTPQAYGDIRTKSAETMRDVLLEGVGSNVITPEMD
ncbi:C-terminal binding protein [Roseomonas marmotae]|uniref:C-terminal binding protein n=1 Tax=Roseomonas marmotae TaxID=2768161 RepID=A0ABS3K6H7_9PROT|nr:C-terminal binding protein [Roseomonas marmotae]MBO1073057.1 C-terminal binding protein [Roseomonas marmotae]QTI79298.1 C-terminal binding protein [Roseomonas marmotae]